MTPTRRHWLWLAAPLAVLAVADVQPAEALVLRLRDGQARIFVEALAGASDPSATVAGAADGAAVLQRATPCCTTLAGLPFRPLPADRVELIAIGPESPVFDFDTGRGYVVALELPPIELPYIVLARRQPGDLPVVKTKYGDAAHENRWGLPLRLEWDILVDEPDTRYLVLHTTEQTLAGRSTTTTRQAIPIILPGIVTAVPGRKEDVAVAHSPDGQLAVQVPR